MINFKAINGVTYTVRAEGQNFEIEKPYDEQGEIKKVYVFEDLSFGKFTEKRKEQVFVSYLVLKDGERVDKRTHSYQDSPEEYDAFMSMVLTNNVIVSLFDGFLKYIENTERLKDENNETLETV